MAHARPPLCDNRPPPVWRGRTQPGTRNVAMLLALILAFTISAVSSAAEWGTPVAVTNAAQLSLILTNTAQTNPIPVRLRGVVTLSDATRGSRNYFCLQDATGGVWVSAPEPPATGQEVELRGEARFVSAEPDPLFVPTAIQVVGRGRSPDPVLMSPGRIRDGRHQRRYVETEGTVLQLFLSNGRLVVHLAGADGWGMAQIGRWASPELPTHWIGGQLRLRGVGAGRGTLSLRLESPEFVTVLREGPGDVFDRPLADPAEVLRNGPSTQLIKLRAIALRVGNGQVFARAGSTPLQLDFLYPFERQGAAKSSSVLPVPNLKAGDRIELVGVPWQTGPRLIVSYSQVRILERGELPEPIRTTGRALAQGENVHDYVQVSGRLLQSDRVNLGRSWLETLQLEDQGVEFRATYESGTNGPALSLRRDDQIELAGIVTATEGVAGFVVRLIRPEDARSLGTSPAVTRTRTLRNAGILAGVLVVAAIWIVLLRGQLHRQRQLVAEQARADNAIRDLNSTLEKRVAERTAELEQAKEELRAALTAERELNELKSRFVSLVSHEFRTPLGITMSAVELLRNYRTRLSPEKIAELLEDIFGSTLRMSGLMEQVLLLGRVEAGKIGFQSRPLDLGALGEKLAAELRAVTQGKCPILFHFTGDLGGAEGDEGLIRHIVSNLLSNAVKYSPEGAPVEFHLHREGQQAVILVRDRGLGIPAADQPRLFEAFHRGSNVGQIPGTGLGLLIVRRCVELHRGAISFISGAGDGTAFTVRLPVFPIAAENRSSR